MKCTTCSTPLEGKPYVEVTSREYRWTEGSVSVTRTYCQPCRDEMLGLAPVEPECPRCHGLGRYAEADVENGPDFDVVEVCDCPAGDRVADAALAETPVTLTVEDWTRVFTSTGETDLRHQIFYATCPDNERALPLSTLVTIPLIPMDVEIVDEILGHEPTITERERMWEPDQARAFGFAPTTDDELEAAARRSWMIG